MIDAACASANKQIAALGTPQQAQVLSYLESTELVIEKLHREVAALGGHVHCRHPDDVVERIAPYVELGFSHLVFHGPGDDQERFLRGFCSDVLPRLRDRFGEDE